MNMFNNNNQNDNDNNESPYNINQNIINDNDLIYDMNNILKHLLPEYKYIDITDETIKILLINDDEKIISKTINNIDITKQIIYLNDNINDVDYIYSILNNINASIKSLNYLQIKQNIQSVITALYNIVVIYTKLYNIINNSSNYEIFNNEISPPVFSKYETLYYLFNSLLYDDNEIYNIDDVNIYDKNNSYKLTNNDMENFIIDVMINLIDNSLLSSIINNIK